VAAGRPTGNNDNNNDDDEGAETMIAPTVHMNGTSRDELIRQLETAYDALNTAIEALTAASPNARDYYPQGPHAYSQASNEHTARLGALHTVRADVERLVNAIDDPASLKTRCADVLDYGSNTTRCKLVPGHDGAHSDGARRWN
jgi:hypothetical protein